ncbi:hypothetical protein AKJ16_DCAP21285 [Drosera capensis]
MASSSAEANIALYSLNLCHDPSGITPVTVQLLFNVSTLAEVSKCCRVFGFGIWLMKLPQDNLTSSVFSSFQIVNEVHVIPADYKD